MVGSSAVPTAATRRGSQPGLLLVGAGLVLAIVAGASWWYFKRAPVSMAEGSPTSQLDRTPASQLALSSQPIAEASSGAVAPAASGVIVPTGTSGPSKGTAVATTPTPSEPQAISGSAAIGAGAPSTDATIDRERIEREARVWAEAEKARQAERAAKAQRLEQVQRTARDPQIAKPDVAQTRRLDVAPTVAPAAPGGAMRPSSPPQAPAPIQKGQGVAEACGGSNVVTEQFCILSECLKSTRKSDPVCVRRAKEAAEMQRRDQSP
ncbi:MAG: hypothetical protein V4684_01595 [Pseudomonadota bacterium]